MQERPERYPELRQRVRDICANFPSSYWQQVDRERAYPEAFVQVLTDTRLLSALIPDEYGGLGLTLTEASVITEEINRSGAVAGQAHAQMYTMGTILRHGSEAQRQQYLPDIASGKLRLQAFGVTEPDAGTDTTNLSTTARREGDHYIINGRKMFISRVRHSDLMLLLARTTPRDQVTKRTDGLSIFLIDMAQIDPEAFKVEPFDVMINNDTSQLTFSDLEIPASSLIGEEGRGFRYLLDGLNAERILIAAECVGDGRWFIQRSIERANSRVIFDRPIGQNQGIQFPIARAYANIEAADLMRFQAAELFDAGLSCGAEANMAKLLAADASWEAANVALQTYGGWGFRTDQDIERKFRETRLYQVAPISTNLILSYIAQHILHLPRSF